MALLSYSKVKEGPCELSVDTIKFLERILKKCEPEKNIEAIIDPVQRAVKLTGFTRKAVFKLQNKASPTIAPNFNRPILHNMLMHFYLNLMKMPSTVELFHSLENTIPLDMDKRMFRRLLAKWGYGWRKIHNRFVVIERPRVTFERFRYLKSIKEYREENRPIIFVDQVLIDLQGRIFDVSEFSKCARECKTFCLIYGVSKHFIYKSCIEAKYKKTLLQSWLEDTLLPSLLTPHVIVLPHNESTNEEIMPLPTQNSVKSELIEWLEYHDIPCHRSLTRFELFTLVEKFTNVSDKLYKIDKVLQYSEHTVLRLPKHLSQLSPAILVRDKVSEKWSLNLQKAINSVQIATAELNSFDHSIYEEEKRMIVVDVRVDEAFDELMTNTMTELADIVHDEDSDIPSLSESE